MIIKGRGCPSHCSTVDPTRWAINGPPAPVEKTAGHLQTTHLHRSKKAPFHHEYVVLGFGPNAKAPTSWVRLERAARFKSSLYISGAGSLQSLFKDVEAQETMSVASSRAELCLNSDQLGAIVIRSPISTPFYVRRSGQFVHLVAVMRSPVTQDRDPPFLLSEGAGPSRCVLAQD